MLTPATSSWQVFSAAAHRMLFFAGALQLLLIMLWWLAVLLARAGAIVLPGMTLPATWAHVFLAVYGLFPFFIFGFLLTVYPRWMGGEPVPAARYVPLFSLLSAGMLLYYLGVFAARGLAVAGVALHLAGWIYGVAILVGVYRRAAHRGVHELALNGALCAGAAGVAAHLAALLTDSAVAQAASRAFGLWLFLGLTLFSVSHRMIPFFGQSALTNYPMVRAAWSMPVATAALAAHALIEWLSLPQWLFVADLPLAIVALQHSLRWDFRRSLTVRLLGMLHIAFAWFGIAMALYALRSLGLLAGVTLYSEYAPLHAFTIGFVAGMVIAMVSRVTLGHSGRQLWADNLTWYSFLGINVTALLRIAAEFVPGAANPAFNIAAALVWLVFLSAWVAHYTPIYLKPRIDGRPG